MSIFCFDHFKEDMSTVVHDGDVGVSVKNWGTTELPLGGATALSKRI